jgi:hypothetical protein
MNFRILSIAFMIMITAAIICAWSYTPAPGGSVSVATFGAKGDGVTDDVAALRAAVNAIATGTNLVFEAGKTYLISAPVYISEKTQFNVYGQDAKIKVMVAFVPSNDLKPGSRGGPIVFWKCTFFTLSDLTLDGNRLERPSGDINDQNTGTHNFYLLTCTDFTITRLRSNNATLDGIYLDSYSTPPGAVTTHADLINRCKNGKIIECSSDNCSRSALTFDFACNMQIIGGFYTNTKGTDPQDGCDVEPDAD